MNSQISPETKITGVFGYPVKHSASPAMHNAAFKACGLDHVYVAFEVKPEHLGDALNGLQALGIRGVNLTIPHKENALRHMDELSPEATATGAVNTVVIESGKLKGYDTDIEGFLKSLSEEADFSPEGKKAVILGAGGAARAVLFALSKSKISEIIVANRTGERAEKLAIEMKKKFPAIKISAIPLDSDKLSEEISSCSLLVNATPLGMEEKLCDVSSCKIPISNTECLHKGLTVYDLIYTPPTTTLLKESEKRGAKTINGISMLVYQGAASFKLWTGREAPVDVMKHAVEEILRERCK